MGDYSEAGNSYDSNQDSDLDETDQAWINEEDGCDWSCSDNDYSISEDGPAGEAYPEPEPPDYSPECHDGETARDDPESDQEYSWKEEADTEIIIEEEREQEEDFSETNEDVDRREEQDETESQISLGYVETSFEDEAENRHGFAKEEQFLSEAGEDEDEYEADHQPHYVCFSGHEQGPEAYLRIRKLITGSMTTHQKLPGVKDVQVDLILQVQAQEQSTKPSHKVHEKKKPSKSSKSLKPVESICYRCHEKCHFDVTCPTRLVTSHSLEVKSDSTSEVISHLVCKFSTSGIMHLSCPTEDYVGLNKDKEDVGSRLKQEGIIPEPDPQKELKPTTNDTLKLEDVLVQAHEEE
ncbi:hypothetical protein DY000_02023817 [Brassica cretica]|uniref:Uncharacterized protein n=1 Tax=Brassica cretica TaxID=69181 RepID=A0ABQ7EBD1_BRACR|nr:hypothetical protein DY000_02023817 [Brassica cretica]